MLEVVGPVSEHGITFDILLCFITVLITWKVTWMSFGTQIEERCKTRLSAQGTVNKTVFLR